MIQPTGRRFQVAALAALLSLGVIKPVSAAVTLALRDSNNASGAKYNSGDTFSLTVYLSITSANDNNVAGIDYQVGSQLGGKDVSGVFNLVSRVTTTSDPAIGSANSGMNNGFISDPDYKDNNTSIPGVLSPNNKTNLGGTNFDGNVLAGVHSNNSISTLTFKVNANIAYGAYTIGFYLPNSDTAYSSISGMNVVNHSFDTLTAYTATAPEPSAVLLALLIGVPVLHRGRTRSLSI